MCLHLFKTCCRRLVRDFVPAGEQEREGHYAHKHVAKAHGDAYADSDEHVDQQPDKCTVSLDDTDASKASAHRDVRAGGDEDAQQRVDEPAGPGRVLLDHAAQVVRQARLERVVRHRQVLEQPARQRLHECTYTSFEEAATVRLLRRQSLSCGG